MDKILEKFRSEMEKEGTEYLKRIWEAYNTNEWSEEKLEIVAEILRSRSADINIPPSLILKNMIISSTPILQDRKIKRYLGVVSSEVVMGTGFLSELGGDVADFFGSRAKGFQNKLSKAREIALAEIAEQTMNKGGNGIIGLDFDYMSFANNIMMLSANGTAVEIEL